MTEARFGNDRIESPLPQNLRVSDPIPIDEPRSRWSACGEKAEGPSLTDLGGVLAGESNRALLTDAVVDSAFDARTPEPVHEAAAMVVAAERALREWRRADLGGPVDERVLGEAASAQVPEEGGDGAIRGEPPPWAKKAGSGSSA